MTKEQRREYGRKYRHEHREQIAEYKRKYYLEHRAELAKRDHEYYQAHKAEISEYNHQYYLCRKVAMLGKSELKHAKSQGCIYPDCFNCHLPDCILGEEDDG